MRNDINIFERLFKQQAAIGKMVLDGARDPHTVADVLQSIIDADAAAAPQKFAQMKNVHGEPIEFTLIVPAGYDHEKALARFAKADKKNCYSFSEALTDKNFSNPSRVLKAGDRLRMRAFEQIVQGTTTSGERMKFQRTLPDNVFVGAQGLPFIFDKRAELPKGKWYSSFDESERLPFLEGYHRVPRVDTYDDGDFSAYLGNFEKVWGQNDAFFCFSDESLVA